MPTFTYTARAINGDLKSATIEAPSRDDVIKQLRQLKLNVVKIDEGTANRKKRGGSIKMRDIVIFTRQFSTMINAGLPLVQALDILANQSENPALKDVTRQVMFDVESGNTVADALRKHPKAFSDLYVNMVAAGEAGGILDTILMRLAVFMEKNDALIRKVKGAMIYPGVIMSVAAIAITVLLVFVIPTFENMFNSAGIGQIGAVEDLSADLLRRQFEINVVGAHELTRLVLPAMRANNEGRIVQCSSVLGLVAAPYRGVYCASKYAIEALSDALRLELRGTGIAVSIIEPGPIRSRFVETALANFKKTVDIESSPHRSLYRARLLAMEAGGKRAFKLEPEAVAAKLVHAVESRHPRARYFVTTPTYFSAVAKRVLPTALLDRIVVWT